MPPIRSVDVPRFGSKLSSSERDKPQPDKTKNRTGRTESVSRCRKDKSGNKRGVKSRFLLKVKLPKFNFSKKVTKEDKMLRRQEEEPATDATKTAVSQGGVGPDSDSVGLDALFFSQRPTETAMSMKEKARHAVCRTISKMLEENQLIRQRLVAISQAK